MSLLGSIKAEHTHDVQVFRFASFKPVEDFLNELGLDDAGVAELYALLATSASGAFPKDLLDVPFERPKKRRPTRFSDGSFPVFYGALEAETAEAEVKYWFSVVLAGPTARTAYYSKFSCKFSGKTKDLRHKRWPGLTHKTDYEFCQQIGAEAVRAGLDGLLTPSARCDAGTNLPVFRRAAIDDLRVESLAAFSLEPSTGVVSTRFYPLIS